MAFLPMTQDIIKYMNEFDKDNILSYQMLLILFGKLFVNEQEFLKDPGDRMGLSHYIVNFLRSNGFQSIVTISDLNKVFNTDTYDVNDKDLYKIFFVLLYEEFSSNDPQISFKIKETLFKFIHQIEDNLNNNTPVVEEFKDEEKASNKDEEKASNEDKLASDWKADLDNEIFPAFPDKFKKSEQKIETPIIKTDEKIEPPVENEQPVFNGIPFIVHNPKYLKEYICRKNLLPYRCAICGLSEWQNEPLALELDSFNGVYTSSNLNNLRFLCPNCYSQVGHHV